MLTLLAQQLQRRVQRVNNVFSDQSEVLRLYGAGSCSLFNILKQVPVYFCCAGDCLALFCCEAPETLCVCKTSPSTPEPADNDWIFIYFCVNCSFKDFLSNHLQVKARRQSYCLCGCYRCRGDDTGVGGLLCWWVGGVL